MELREYLRIFRRAWPIILAGTLLGIMAGVLLTVTTTPQYVSTARLFFSTPQKGIAAYQGGAFSQQRVASYANLVSGQNLAKRVVTKLHLDESPAALASQISSSVIPDTVILQVSVTDPSPERAQRLANAVAEEFTAFVAELETPPGGSTPIKASLVDDAQLPSTPVRPRPLRNLALTGIFGLVLGFGTALLRERLDTTVKSANDVSAATDSTVLGSIRFDSRAKAAPLITDLDPHAPRVEAFRMLRTNLEFIDVDKRSRVIVVTSASHGEGKTTTAINLAITLAQANERVLLIEADLRAPQVSRYLQIDPAVGLTTVLIGRIAVEDAIQRWDAGDLAFDVLPSGGLPPNPAELLHSEAMDGILTKLQPNYTVIVIDAPPILHVTDAVLLAASSDGALLVVRVRKTTRDQLSLAAERLRAVDAKLTGSVLNMIEGRDESQYG